MDNSEIPPQLQPPPPTSSVPEDDNHSASPASSSSSLPPSPPAPSSSASDEDYDPLNSSSNNRRKRKKTVKEHASNNKRKGVAWICRHDGCHYRAQRYLHLREHDRTHSDSQLPYSCLICKRATRSRTQHYILRHIEKCHSAELALHPGASDGGAKSPLMRYVDINQEILDREKELIDQWLISEECLRKARGNNAEAVTLKPSTSGTSQLPSTSTSQTFSSPATTITTTTTTTYCCPECGMYSFKDFESLCHHYRAKHSQMQPFTCMFSECGFSGAFMEDMARHFNKFHKTKDQSFMCHYVDTDKEAIAREEEKLKQWLNVVDVEVPSSVSGRPPYTAAHSSKVLQTSTSIASTESAVDDRNSVNSTNQPSTASSTAESLGPLVICSVPREDGSFSYICQRPNCRQELSTYRTLVRHDRIHRNFKPWRCRICGLSYIRRDNVKIHIRNNHFKLKSDKSSKIPKKNFSDYLLETLEENSELLMLERDLLEKAKKITLSLSTDEENGESSDEEKEEKQGIENDSHELGELVLRQNDFKNYICQRPTGLLPYSICEKKFSSIRELKRHDRIHRGVKPYRCRICGYTFSLKGNLVRHIVHAHSEDLKTERLDREDLIEEDAEQLQIEEELFDRAKEQMLFTSANREKEDDKESSSSEEESDEKNEEQEVENDFPEAGELILRRQFRHNLAHYVCQRPTGLLPNSICEKEFQCINHLKQHDRIHRGIKPYRCRMCGYTFSLKGNLVKHIVRAHSEDLKAERFDREDFIEEDAEQLQIEEELFDRAKKQMLNASANRKRSREEGDSSEEEEFTDDDTNSNNNSHDDLDDGSENSDQTEEEDDESLESLCARLEELELKYKFACRLDPDGCQWLFASEGDRLTHEREHLGIEAYVCQWPVESGTNDNFTEGICGRRFLRAQFTREHIKAEHCSAELQEDHYIEQFVWEDEELLATS